MGSSAATTRYGSECLLEISITQDRRSASGQNSAVAGLRPLRPVWAITTLLESGHQPAKALSATLGRTMPFDSCRSNVRLRFLLLGNCHSAPGQTSAVGSGRCAHRSGHRRTCERRSGSVAPLAAYQGSVRPNIRPSKTNGSVRRACTYLGRISLGRLPPCIGWTH
jgi:hypothetical protein